MLLTHISADLAVYSFQSRRLECVYARIYDPNECPIFNKRRRYRQQTCITYLLQPKLAKHHRISGHSCFETTLLTLELLIKLTIDLPRLTIPWISSVYNGHMLQYISPPTLPTLPSAPTAAFPSAPPHLC